MVFQHRISYTGRVLSMISDSVKAIVFLKPVFFVCFFSNPNALVEIPWSSQSPPTFTHYRSRYAPTVNTKPSFCAMRKECDSFSLELYTQ